MTDSCAAPTQPEKSHTSLAGQALTTLCCLLAIVLAGPLPAQAQAFSMVHNFVGGSGDGSEPLGNLVPGMAPKTGTELPILAALTTSEAFTRSILRGS